MDGESSGSHAEPTAPTARLFLDAVGAHVVARVNDRSERGLTVSRELPFLRLGSRVVDESGRAAEVSGVSVVIEDGTPRLVLELAYAVEAVQVEPAAAPSSAISTVPFIMARPGSEPAADVAARIKPAAALPGGVAKPSRGEDTLLFVTHRDSQPEAAPAEQAPLVVARAGAWALVLRWLGQLASLVRGLRRSAT
jgi:hypothetical protein